MARFEFKLPDIGEGVVEGEIVAWHVKEGDQVAEDQVMVEVMTDKATVTIGAPRSGKIAELRAQVGSTVQVGDVLVVIQTGNGARAHAHAAAPADQPAQPTTASAVGDIAESLPGANFFANQRAVAPDRGGDAGLSGAAAPSEHHGGSSGATNGREHFSERPLATPATRKLARDLGLDLRRVAPTGADGRVTQEDVRAASSGAVASIATETVARPGQPGLGRVAARPRVAGRQEGLGKPHKGAEARDERVPFVGMRRLIAERMQQSKNTAAHFTFVEECDAARLLSLRARLRPEAEARGIELTYMPFIVKAVCCALARHPMLNSSLDVAKNELVFHGHCNIGIAAATDQGLVVPVLHRAEQLTLFELAAEINRLGALAREGKLTVPELSGSTFTVTSLGKQAGLFAVPILNLPNVGILGVHRIKERPVVRDGQIAIGQIMLLSLSLDHRIVDGHVGAAFAYDVIKYLEEPALMFMD